MDPYELDGAHAEIERLAALSQSRKPLYSDRYLSKRTPGSEALGAPQDARLTADDVLGAVRELAEQHGVSTARVRGMAMLATAKAGLGNSPEEQAKVISEVMLSLERGQDAVSDAQILELSGRGDDLLGLAELTDAEHLQAAAVLARSGQTGWQGAEKAIAQRARELGVPDPLGKGAVSASPATMQLALNMAGAGEAEDEDATVGLTQESQALALAAGGHDTASAVVARHPELSHLFRAGRTSSRKHPRKAGRTVSTRTRAHSGDTGDEDTQDRRQPARGGVVHAKVRELIEKNPDQFAPDRGREGEGTGNVSYSPSPYRSPGRSGKPQSPR